MENENNEIEEWKKKQGENNKLFVEDTKEVKAEPTKQVNSLKPIESIEPIINCSPVYLQIEINEQENYVINLLSNKISKERFRGLMDRLSKVLRLIESDPFLSEAQVTPTINSPIPIKNPLKYNKYNREDIIRFIKFYYSTTPEERMKRWKVEFPTFPYTITHKIAYLKKRWKIKPEEIMGGNSKSKKSFSKSGVDRKFTREQIARLLKIYYHEDNIAKRWELALKEYPNLSKYFFTSAHNLRKRYNITPSEVGLVEFPKKGGRRQLN